MSDRDGTLPYQRELMIQHRREITALDAQYAAKERELLKELRDARLAMANRHANELAEVWRGTRKDSKP